MSNSFRTLACLTEQVAETIFGIKSHNHDKETDVTAVTFNTHVMGIQIKLPGCLDQHGL